MCLTGKELVTVLSVEDSVGGIVSGGDGAEKATTGGGAARIAEGALSPRAEGVAEEGTGRGDTMGWHGTLTEFCSIPNGHPTRDSLTLHDILPS